ncbi:uncharacterized protein BXZ73DRAFT_78908 [Epithele typhae]|uniref:uncharacterized protein n=1 Tax=Epithele typhae TaxID=378194 RepID=UPI0020083274|nr:uncharacterized protein BXZ73DRAFT_78908 [Epithele typhae]KAH9925932.1 hypothetical protein BXZ73DRAFT_78908 [Epithele typhae]
MASFIALYRGFGLRLYAANKQFSPDRSLVGDGMQHGVVEFRGVDKSDHKAPEKEPYIQREVELPAPELLSYKLECWDAQGPIPPTNDFLSLKRFIVSNYNLSHHFYGDGVLFTMLCTSTALHPFHLPDCILYEDCILLDSIKFPDLCLVHLCTISLSDFASTLSRITFSHSIGTTHIRLGANDPRPGTKKTSPGIASHPHDRGLVYEPRTISLQLLRPFLDETHRLPTDRETACSRARTRGRMCPSHRDGGPPTRRDVDIDRRPATGGGGGCEAPRRRDEGGPSEGTMRGVDGGWGRGGWFPELKTLAVSIFRTGGAASVAEVLDSQKDEGRPVRRVMVFVESKLGWSTK